MSRYNSTSLIKDNNERSRKATTILPSIARTDRLDKLAHAFYEDVSLWWVIASANGLGLGSYIVPKNTTLRIPDKTNVQDVIIKNNQSR